jgi:hypothetical protein
MVNPLVSPAPAGLFLRGMDAILGALKRNLRQMVAFFLGSSDHSSDIPRQSADDGRKSKIVSVYDTLSII